MEIFLLAITAFILSAAGLGIGVILKKRTPLKGSCGGTANAYGSSNPSTKSCGSCSCKH